MNSETTTTTTIEEEPNQEFFRVQLDAQGVLPSHLRESYLAYATERWDVSQALQSLILETGLWCSDNMLYRNSSVGEVSASSWLLNGVGWVSEQIEHGLPEGYYASAWRLSIRAEPAEEEEIAEEEETAEEEEIAEEEETAIWRKELFDYHAITEWEPLGDGGLYFGVELEINNRECRRLTDLKLPACLAGAEVDGSLDPVFGLELVFHPQSWKYLREGGLLRFVSYLHERGFRRGHDEYGLHVHLTRSAFYNEAHIKRFYDFFMGLSPLERREVGRRDDNSYCEKCSTFKDDGYPTTTYKARWERRCGRVNLCNNETVEVRLFRSTLDPSHLADSLAWCKAVFQESRKCRPTFEACLERAQRLVAELLG